MKEYQKKVATRINLINPAEHKIYIQDNAVKFHFIYFDKEGHKQIHAGCVKCDESLKEFYSNTNHLTKNKET